MAKQIYCGPLSFQSMSHSSGNVTVNSGTDSQDNHAHQLLLWTCNSLHSSLSGWSPHCCILWKGKLQFIHLETLMNTACSKCVHSLNMGTASQVQKTSCEVIFNFYYIYHTLLATSSGLFKQSPTPPPPQPHNVERKKWWFFLGCLKSICS